MTSIALTYLQRKFIAQCFQETHESVVYVTAHHVSVLHRNVFGNCVTQILRAARLQNEIASEKV